MEQLLILKPLMTNLGTYSSLYTPESSSDEAQFENFSGSLNIPSIDPETSSGRDEPFTVGELKSALLSMQSGK